MPWLGTPALCLRKRTGVVLWRPLPALWDHEQVCGPLGLRVLMAKFRARARTPRPEDPCAGQLLLQGAPCPVVPKAGRLWGWQVGSSWTVSRLSLPQAAPQAD